MVNAVIEEKIEIAPVATGSLKDMKILFSGSPILQALFWNLNPAMTGGVESTVIAMSVE